MDSPLPDKLLMLHPLRLEGIRAQPGLLVFLVIRKPALEPLHMGVALKREVMREIRSPMTRS